MNNPDIENYPSRKTGYSAVVVLPIAAISFWMSLKRYRKAYDQLAV